MLWIVMPATGSCQLMPLNAAAPSSGALASPIAIDRPVGQGPLAKNRPDDVRTIQDALNRVTLKGAAGGPTPFLAVDGICGPKTNAAIGQFQRLQLHFVDGVIEPNKKTIVKLNEIVAPISDDDLRNRVRLALPLVAQAIVAALGNLRAIISSGPNPTGLAVTAADRLNRHFKLNTLSPSDQSAARVDLFRSFTRYSAVMVNTDAIQIDAVDEFDLDKTNPKIALTTPKGFFDEGQTDNVTKKRLDRIHLGLGFFAPNVSPEFGAFIILHELSHFVGHSDGRFIEDNGRGWFDDVFMKSLSADQRLTNADSYAGFAHECRVGSPAKPAFVKTAPGGLGGAR
ncbi:MAG TPA: peptidoglycan-binding protein [Pirellulales bacterium]|jgi:peptidoglycan hydrolase-like protein with peptidoglycan-binding domain|nr:peptidoglycan-binding protein [Pirellulales bacterium]